MHCVDFLFILFIFVVDITHCFQNLTGQFNIFDSILYILSLEGRGDRRILVQMQRLMINRFVRIAEYRVAKAVEIHLHIYVSQLCEFLYKCLQCVLSHFKSGTIAFIYSLLRPVSVQSYTLYAIRGMCACSIDIFYESMLIICQTSEMLLNFLMGGILLWGKWIRSTALIWNNGTNRELETHLTIIRHLRVSWHKSPFHITVPFYGEQVIGGLPS